MLYNKAAKNFLAKDEKYMNRFVLNETSYHGAGAINSIPEEIKEAAKPKVIEKPIVDETLFKEDSKVETLEDDLDKTQVLEL